MAVVEGGWWSWASRLQDAADAVHRAAAWMGSATEGPFSTVLRTAASDVWGGPFADQLRGAVRSIDQALVPWTEHLFRLHTALDQALTEVKIAMAAEASGVPSTYDPIAALTPWRRWPEPSLPAGHRAQEEARVSSGSTRTGRASSAPICAWQARNCGPGAGGAIPTCRVGPW